MAKEINHLDLFFQDLHLEHSKEGKIIIIKIDSQKKCVEWLEIDVLPLPEDFKIEMEKLGILKIQKICE